MLGTDTLPRLLGGAAVPPASNGVTLGGTPPIRNGWVEPWVPSIRGFAGGSAMGLERRLSLDSNGRGVPNRTTRSRSVIGPIPEPVQPGDSRARGSNVPSAASTPVYSQRVIGRGRSSVESPPPPSRDRRCLSGCPAERQRHGRRSLDKWVESLSKEWRDEMAPNAPENSPKVTTPSGSAEFLATVRMHARPDRALGSRGHLARFPCVTRCGE